MSKWVMMFVGTFGMFAILMACGIGGGNAFTVANQAISWRLFSSVIFFGWMWMRLK